MKTEPTLPNEIQDRILDFLYDSNSDLKTCALVCRAWVPASRYHLFSKVELNCTNWGMSDYVLFLGECWNHTIP